MSHSNSVIANIGGGRWGQLLLSILANMQLPFDGIVAVSTANAQAVRDKIVELNLSSSTPLDISPTIDDLLSQYNVKAAVIVNSAREHFDTALRLIKKGIHVLIEKPIVLCTKEMQILIEEAKYHHVCIVPGLSYRFCSYIHHFSAEVAKMEKPKKFTLNWSDARDEVRYGQLKKHDASIHIVQDIFPHVWTILSSVFQCPTLNILTSEEESHGALVTVSINKIEGVVVLKRNALKRQRHLSIEFDSEKLILDFAIEPGEIILGDKNYSADALWNQKRSPLTQQLAYFFSIIQKNKSLPKDLQLCLDSVACTELVTQHLMGVSKV